MEEVLGATLFDRRRTGYVATVQGQELIPLAERVELDVVGVARRVAGHWQGHAGDLRITTSDSILLYFLTPVIASFKAQNPAIKVEVIVGNTALNLARGGIGYCREGHRQAGRKSIRPKSRQERLGAPFQTETE